MTQNLDARRYFNVPLFGCRQMKTARQQKASDGLHVSAAQPATGDEGRVLLVRLRSIHILILNRSERGRCANLACELYGELSDADF
jgi:hypothetical protein